jgi:hypothetical protein
MISFVCGACNKYAYLQVADQKFRRVVTGA